MGMSRADGGAILFGVVDADEKQARGCGVRFFSLASLMKKIHITWWRR